MKKINTALSNEVYMDENYVYKHIVVNPFKEIMCKNEIAVINAYDSDLRVIESTDKEIKLNIVDGITKERYTDDEIIRIADEIKRFHQTNIDNKELTPFQEAYEFLGGKKDISKALEILSKDPVLLHNDLVEGNILISEDKVRLIDFEYSWYGNKIFDVASFISEREIDESQKELFISQFDIDRDELTVVVDFLNDFWSLWADYLYEETGKEIYKVISKIKKEA